MITTRTQIPILTSDNPKEYLFIHNETQLRDEKVILITLSILYLTLSKYD